jgi:hypothetical protein
MQGPSIKGTLFAGVVEDLERALETGVLSRADVESTLESDDLTLIEEKVLPTGWYDIHAYHRIVGLLCEADGGAPEVYWHHRGVRAADRLVDAGIYQQMDYLGRMLSGKESDPSARFNALKKDLRLLLSIHSSVLNFGRWEIAVAPGQSDRYQIEIHEVTGIPDGIFRACAGTFNRLSTKTNSSKRHGWEFERLGVDVIAIRMTDGV